MDPEGPSQPEQKSGLNQAENPASKTSEEESKSQDTSSTSDATIDRRTEHDVPSTHDGEPQSQSLGQGDTGELTEIDISQSDAENYSKSELDGEQMRAPGEGEVAEAVRSGGGGGHAEEPSLTAKMDDKMEEHKDALHARGERTEAEIQEEEKEDWTGKKADVDVAEALGGRDTKVVLAAEDLN